MIHSGFSPPPLPPGQPSENMVALTGMLGSATIIGSFVASVPSVLAVVLNYIQQGAVRDTWLQSHFRWQLRTFWFAALWIAVAVLLMLSLIGLPLAMLLILGAGLWVLYRVARGWLALLGRRSLPLPAE